MILVKDLYDELAIATGFPMYTSDSDTPDITRFLLQILSEGLQNTVDDLYLSNNILERNDTIKTIPNRDEYGIDGIIKNLQLIDNENNRVYQLPYNDYFNKHKEVLHKTKNKIDNLEEKEHTGRPTSYVIRGGYLRLLPMPDKEYTLKVTLSTTDMVYSNQDIYSNTFKSVDDSILGNKAFASLVLLKAISLLFARCQNANYQIYDKLYQDRRKTFIEQDSATMQAQRGWRRRAGHYNPRRGLLD